MSRPLIPLFSSKDFNYDHPVFVEIRMKNRWGSYILERIQVPRGEEFGMEFGTEFEVLLEYEGKASSGSE